MKFGFIFIIVLTTVSQSFHKSIDISKSPCNDFYDYVCAKDTRSISNLTFTKMNQELEILKPNVTIENNGTFIALDKIVKLTRVMKWCTEIEVLFTGVFTVDYFGDLHSENKMIHSERYTAVVSRLKEINTTMANIFYNALHANTEILQQMEIPISSKNKFLHHLFNTLKTNAINELETTTISEAAKKSMKKGIEMSKVYFAFYDFNNITVYKEAKLVYETEYYRLKKWLSPKDLTNPIAEKILRLGAIDASMTLFAKTISEYDIRFLFQAIVANPANDGFQYLNNNHITVITRNDLNQPEKAIADTIFVTTHEIMHRVYPYGNFLMNSNVTTAALQCARREVQMLGDTDAVKPISGWFNKDVAHEDVVNIMAMRMIMKMATIKSTNEKQLKEALETIVGGLCKQSERKNELIPHHNPLETSLNCAVRQYPLFKTLYGCRIGDRMFAKHEEFCKPFGDDVKVEDYAVKSSSANKDVGGFFKDLLKTSKSFNFTYGI
ncbi:Peptidase_M13 domain-containing protein [Caenorhabditis elegans]|uniref:Peptidase_M13 domain-containing protein n=1 Tax=Caenorhabditis elegans TaxID=6239 RepID=G5EC50_CAEEL|nr:Peptidase_M13 domain-containing protein [Caenorhabditis elegans]CAA88051.2 Peptidase_M13 domain-containing protein [Caenorhabditis elegans]|eukprot:NP_509680.2 Uncharacterized protein CELE_F19C6.4 [Caenorhabditis elegans]